MNIEIYTDASFDPVSKRAVLTYYFNGVMNNKVIENTENTTAELLTIIWALESISPSDNYLYIIYTDCKTAVDLQSKPRYNKPIYNKFLDVVLKKNLKLVHVKGHKRSNDKTPTDMIFSSVDKNARKILRQYRNP